MRFFSYLFYPRGLKPYTTFHYRATSSQPLLIYFNIDQRVQAVHCVLITMKVYRPKEPSSRLPWNLSKVYVPRDPRYHLCNSCLKVSTSESLPLMFFTTRCVGRRFHRGLQLECPVCIIQILFYADQCTTEISVPTREK